jgi:hypothetical protein
VIDIVIAVSDGKQAPGLAPEHLWLLSLCRLPVAVADLASDTDLPLGVVRVLLGDLRDRGLIVVAEPGTQPSSEEDVLRSVLDGLRAL